MMTRTNATLCIDVSSGSVNGVIGKTVYVS